MIALFFFRSIVFALLLVKAVGPTVVVLMAYRRHSEESRNLGILEILNNTGYRDQVAV